MEKIKFEDGHARKIYTDYLNAISTAIGGTDKAFQEGVLMEINSHIFESVSAGGGTEVERIRQAIAELGPPEGYLRDLATEKKFEEALASYNPVKILRTAGRLARSSVRHSAYFVGYLLILSMSVLFFAKIFFPARTGFFYRGGRPVAFGFVRDTDGLTEVLHLWFFPVVVLAMGMLYFVFTAILKKQRARRKPANGWLGSR